jgi:penicillin-binding protein activator
MKMARWAAVLLTLATITCGMETKRVDPDQDDEVGGTGIDSADLRATADKMVRSLLSNPQIFAKGTPFVVIESPQNRTRFQIDSSIFVTKMRAQLMQAAQGRIAFIAREDLKAVLDERERKRSGAVSVPTDATGKADLAAAPLGTQYFLTGTLQSISKQSGKAEADYILASFRVVDAETSLLVWEDSSEWKKVGGHGVIYR